MCQRLFKIWWYVDCTTQSIFHEEPIFTPCAAATGFATPGTCSVARIEAEGEREFVSYTCARCAEARFARGEEYPFGEHIVPVKCCGRCCYSMGGECAMGLPADGVPCCDFLHAALAASIQGQQQQQQ
jgi:hypothetical protein